MAADTVLEINDDNFEVEVLKSQLPVLVDFWADWCMPCKALGPIIDELAQDFEGRVKFGKLDTDANRDASVKFNITAIPTVILFKNGEVIQKFVGVTPKTEFTTQLEQLVG